MQCLEDLTVVLEDPPLKNEALKKKGLLQKKDFEEKESHGRKEPLPQLKICAEVFLKYLTMKRPENFDTILYYKLLISCLRGLQNIIVQDSEFLNKEIGLIMGIIKSYMVFEIRGVEFILPQKVMPSTLSIPDPTANAPRERKGGKIAKQRKTKLSSGGKKSIEEKNQEFEIPGKKFGGYTPVSNIFDSNSDTDIKYNRRGLMTSDSDFSDGERGSNLKLTLSVSKIRQAALVLFLNTVKLLDKKTVFSFWSNFIPDGSPSGLHTLATCIMKDPSPKGRMAGLNVLLTFITTSKLYLALAEYSDKTTSFTPFSVILGNMIKELHKCLILALNENSVPVLLQVLKCLAALVQATPYTRLGPGLMKKIVRNVKEFVYHRDANVQVAALIVLGCVLASEPVIPETKEAFLRKLPKRHSSVSDGNLNNLSDNSHAAITKAEEEIEYANFSSEEEEDISVGSTRPQVPWLLDRCLTHLGVSCIDDRVSEQAEMYFQLAESCFINLFEASCGMHFVNK